jgi:gliding motility-associated-like protein
MRHCLYIFLFGMLSVNAWAAHIVGGEMIYDYLGNDQYRITLKIYRDCTPGNNAAPFDGISSQVPMAIITVFDADNNMVALRDIGVPEISRVPPTFNNACIIPGEDVCIEEGVYTTTLTLPSRAGGYTVVYQRCCRNAGVANLVNSNVEGSSYYTTIPGPESASNNNSPRFKELPPIYLCQNVNMLFDHSATDPDGDELVYSLCAPYTGLDACCAALGMATPQISSGCMSPPASCPQQGSPPPYQPVLFQTPFSGTYPIPSNPAFSIHPVTGQLAGTPTLTGLYVVGICIQEYRNSVLINTHFRDFQFTVINCTVTTLSQIADQEQQCQGQTITFRNMSINQSTSPSYHWDFGVASLTNDTSNLVNPSYTYQDTGMYMVRLIANPGKPCTDTLWKRVYVYPPLKINYARQARQCLRGNSFAFAAGGDYTQQTLFRWDFTASATPSVSTLRTPSDIRFLAGGLYSVSLMASQFACRDTFTDTIRVIGRPQARINNMAGSYCDPGRVGFSNGSRSDLPLQYFWTFSNGQTSSEFEPVQEFSPPGVYSASLIVETTEMCHDTSMAVFSPIVVNPRPKSSFTFSPGEASIFEPDISVGSLTNEPGSKLMFYFGDGAHSSASRYVHSYSNYGNYRITQLVENQFGCIDSTSAIVRILPEFRLWIPNCFTPDGNGRNDRFMPVTIGTEQYDFQIYNRWGERVFRTEHPEEGWDGSYKGLECPQGVYTWRLSFKNVTTEDTELHFGHVTLLRSP